MPITNGYSSTITSTGAWDTSVHTPTPIFTFSEPEPDDLLDIAYPKCFQCGKEVQSVSSFVRTKTLIIIIHCHGEERRVDISLKRFKNDKVDAINWFSDTFQWVFGEEAQWRKVKPEPSVSTIHADRKIISDWLDNI